MPALPSLGLALLGSGNFAAHLAAIRTTADLRLVGGWGEALADSGCEVFTDPSQALIHPDVRGVVICTPLREREHWIGQALRAGRHVLCASPPAINYRRMKQLAADCRSAGVQICLVTRLPYAAVVRELVSRNEQEQKGGVLYFSLKAAIPKTLLRGTREGVLLHWGVECFKVLSECFGPLDSVYARSRSLGLNRPEEDVASALLRFRNGVEGMATLNGLGDEAGVELREWCERGDRILSFAWGEITAQRLEPQYADFKTLLAEGCTPANTLEGMLEGVKWAEWFQQSARLDREIHAEEVVHG